METIQAEEDVTARTKAEREWGEDVIVIPPDHDAFGFEEVLGIVKSSGQKYKAVRVKEKNERT